MNIMKSGFSSSKLSERPTSESIPGISGDGRKWFVDDNHEATANIYGGANSLYGAWGGLETNDADASYAIFNRPYSSSFSLGSGSSDYGIITTDPYEGDFHFAYQGTGTRIGTLRVCVNPFHQYFMECYMRSVGATQSKLYSGFYTRDADGNFVNLRNCGGLSNTTLSQDLEDGDTYVYVTDASVFTATSGTDYYRHILFFPPNHAKYFRPWYYTRIGYGDPTIYYSERDTSNNRLRISTNGNTDGSGDTTWSGGFIPAGTPVGRGAAGGSYNYCLASNATISTSWERKSNILNTNQYGVRSSSCAFRPGTKYLQTMNLMNYGQDNNSALYFDNWRLINITDPGQSSPGNYESYAQTFNDTFGQQGTRLTKQGALLTNDLNEIVMPGLGGEFSYGRSIYKSSNLKLEIDPEDPTCRGSLASDSGGGIKIASGTTSYLVDLSGNGNNMELYGNPYMGFGTTKQDGTDDHAFRNSLSYTGYYTFGIWMKIPSGQDNNGKYWFAEANRGESGCWTTASYIGNGSGSDDIVIHRTYDNSGAGTETVQSTSAINDGVWHYVTVVMNKDQASLRLYFDGRLEDEEAGVFNDSNYASLMVGGTIGCLGTSSMTGQIGPYHMYTNEALTDDQVYHNYNYFWESRYRWLSDSTIGSNWNQTNNSISY